MNVGPRPRTTVGRYELFEELASGGMATVYVGRVAEGAGKGRIVAVKRLHPRFAAEPELVARFQDEARIVSHIRHPNVVPTYDAVIVEREILLVMEYIEGASLANVLEAAPERSLPPAIACSVVHDVLLGLHSAHETRTPSGTRLDTVHRDMSPQNVMVGVDGLARVLDFGIAKAVGRAFVTVDQVIRGKLRYAAPEVLGGNTSPASDVYAVGVMLWECLTGQRYLTGTSPSAQLAQALTPRPRSARDHAPAITWELDAVVLRALQPDLAYRYADAREMAVALDAARPRVSRAEVADLLTRLLPTVLAEHARKVAAALAAPW